MYGPARNGRSISELLNDLTFFPAGTNPFFLMMDVKFHWAAPGLYGYTWIVKDGWCLKIVAEHGNLEHNIQILDVIKNGDIKKSWIKTDRLGDTFLMYPHEYGFTTPTAVKNELGVTRMAIYQQKKKYHWLSAGTRTKFIKLK